MSALYVVRFDDICPTMNWPVWARIEEALTRNGIRPIVAVVPDNRDPKLRVEPPREDFWVKVRAWQARGWTIGWHGYQHQYGTSASGVIGIHRGSEFAGLPADTQRRKLSAAFEIFRSNGVHPQVWVAPGHSFDMTTVGLLPEFGIRAISDGFYWRLVSHSDCTWIPQQLWRFRTMPFGVWTVCLHINSWQAADIESFDVNLRRFSRSIIPVQTLLRERPPALTVIDRVFSSVYRFTVLARHGRALETTA